MQHLFFIFHLFLSVTLFLFLFFLPGNIFLLFKNDLLKKEERIFLSFVLGMVLFTVLAVVFGLLRLRFLLLPVFVILNLFLIKKHSLKKLFLPFGFFLKNKKLIFVLLGAVLLMGFINFPSGWKFGKDILFWSSQGHDGLWHVALMEEIKNNFPPNNPLYAGRSLSNYHFSSDILMGEFYRIFPFFSSLDLYFRFFPVLFAFLIGLGVYCFAAREWGKKAGFWAVFFTCFCGSFGYVLSVLKGGFLFTGETAFWASQGNSILGNPPHTLGIIILTAVLVGLQLWQKEKNKKFLYLNAFLGFGLATVKVSSGLTLVLALGAAGFYYFLFEKKYNLLVLAVFLGLSNLVLLKIISPSAESFLIFEPLWFTRTMMTSKLGNENWELRRQHYMWVDTWRSWLRLAWLETGAVFLFIVGNSGMRILGFVKTAKELFKKKSPLDIFIFSSLFFSLLIVLLFIQKGLVFNLIQFIQIYLHFLGLLAAGSLVFLLSKIKKPSLRTVLITLIVFLSIPTSIGNLSDFYWKSGPLAKVTDSELQALGWLKNNSSKEEIVLTKPFYGKAETRYKNQPWPISAWYSTAYVFVFSGRYAYLSGEEQLMITGYETKPDLEKINNFFEQSDLKESEEFLKQNRIKFIYFRKDEQKKQILPEIGNLKIEQIFENEEVLIYKIT